MNHTNQVYQKIRALACQFTISVQEFIHSKSKSIYGREMVVIYTDISGSAGHMKDYSSSPSWILAQLWDLYWSVKHKQIYLYTSLFSTTTAVVLEHMFIPERVTLSYQQQLAWSTGPITNFAGERNKLYILNFKILSLEEVFFFVYFIYFLSKLILAWML